MGSCLLAGVMSGSESEESELETVRMLVEEAAANFSTGFFFITESSVPYLDSFSLILFESFLETTTTPLAAFFEGWSA